MLAFSLMYGVVAAALWRRRGLPDGLARAAFVAWIGLGVASLVQCHFRDEEVLMLIAFTAGLGLLSGTEASDPVNRTLSA